MGDALRVQVLESVDNLSKESASFLLIKPFFAYDVVEQLTSLGIFHDQIDAFGVFNDLNQLDKVYVRNLLQNLDLSDNSIVVRLLFNP